MTEAVKIRGVAQSDFDQWLPLCEGYNAFYERIGPKAVPMQVTRTTWARFFDHCGPVHCLVAEASERLIGTAHFILSPQHGDARADLLLAGFVHE